MKTRRYHYGGMGIWSAVLGVICWLVVQVAAQSPFAEVGKAAGVDDGGTAEGAAWADYDRDGDLDLYLSNWTGAQRLYQNAGAGVFVDVAEGAGIEGDMKAHGAVWGDYDGDGNLDLYVPTCADGDDRCRKEAVNRLYKNTGAGRFVERGASAGVADEGKGSGAAWGDYDGDGNLDLYLANVGENPLYLNTGAGRFVERGASAGVADEGDGHSVASDDYDGDGDLDLYVANMDRENPLYQNNSDGTFVEIGTESGLSEVGSWMTFSWGDYDGDGDLDLFTSHLDGRSRFYENLEDGSFAETSESTGIGGRAVGAGWGDYDGDGDLDLFLTGGSQERNRLYQNVGDGTFTRIDVGGGGGPCVAWGDYDGDGDLDLYVGNAFARNQLFRNDGSVQQWLTVELVGTASNRDGIGAALTAVAGTRRQRRGVEGGGSHAQSSLPVEFGLGGAGAVDSLIVAWPSGRVDVFTDIPANQQIRVFEGREAYRAVEPTVWNWESVPRDSLAVGAKIDVRAMVRPALFEADAEITSVAADLSALGGPAALPLVERGDGSYRLEASGLAVEGANGLRFISVQIEQATSLGPYQTNVRQRIVVVPAADLSIADDALAPDWQVETQGGAQPVHFTAAGPVYQGEMAGAFQVAPESFVGWTLILHAPEPVSPVGYTALRFKMHVGAVTGEVLSVKIGNLSETLVGRNAREDMRLDLDSKDWQEVEIPLEGLNQAIESIRFGGDLTGTLYLDDVRLVAATPSPPTAIVEEHTSTRPQSFALEQNYPNPFNSETAIRFALSTSEEVELAIFNLAGQKVAVLVDGRRLAGVYAVRWDGRDDGGRGLASGIYLYRLRAGQEVETRKLVLLR